MRVFRCEFPGNTGEKALGNARIRLPPICSRHVAGNSGVDWLVVGGLVVLFPEVRRRRSLCFDAQRDHPEASQLQPAFEFPFQASSLLKLSDFFVDGDDV